MNTIIIEACTPQGDAILARYGTEWVVVEDRGTRLTIADLDETTQMSFPNPHVKMVGES